MEMYSPVRGSTLGRTLHGKCKVTVMPLAEIEAMLQARWPGKIQPISCSLGSQKRIRQEYDGRKEIFLPGSCAFEE